MAKQPAARVDGAWPALGAPDGRVTGSDVGAAVLWALLDAAPDGLLIVDEAGHMQLANRRVEELFGYERSDLLGLSVEMLLPERSRDVHVRHRATFAEHPHVRSMGDGHHLLGRRRDGTEFPVDISLSPLTTETRRWVIAAIRDSTERWAHEDQRQDRAVSDEDDRIARELGETVIRSLFGTGLRLQAMRSRVGQDERETLDEISREIDDSIQLVRAAIFGMTSRGGSS